MAKTNGGQGQLTGPFVANTEMLYLVKADAKVSAINYLTKVGITAERGSFVRINGIEFEIGKTGILEFEDVKITSLKFSKDANERAIIDYYYE